MHLAAKVDVVGRWTDYERANVEGTRTRRRRPAARPGVGRLVHVSSPSVAHAGRPLVGAGAEPADPARARGHYARTKAAAELLALAADSPDARGARRPARTWCGGPATPSWSPGSSPARAAGRLPVLGSGAALIDTTYVDNAADALVAAVDACGPAHGEALVVTQRRAAPRRRDARPASAGRPASAPPRRHVPVPWPLGRPGPAVDGSGRATRRTDTPPLTRFLAEQLTTAHWFDQRHTRTVLRWSPEVGLEAGFERLTAWYGAGCPATTTPH